MRPHAHLLSFADFEWQAQGLALEPTLQALGDFLDTHAELVGLVHDDLVRGLKHPRAGRAGLSAAQVLRALVLQRVKAWDLRELREGLPTATRCGASRPSTASPSPSTTLFIAPSAGLPRRRCAPSMRP